MSADDTVPPLVHEGLDGWLFLQGGTNFVTSLYSREAGNLPDDRLAAWTDLIEKRTRRCRALGIACAHVVIPDKLTIYGHRLAAPLIDPDMSPALRLAEQLGKSLAADSFVDLVAPMRARRDDCDLFWRTDTHLTPEGGCLVYEALCKQLSLMPQSDLLSRPHSETTRVLDLGGHVDPMRWEDFRKYDFLSGAQRVWTNRITQYLEDPFFEEQLHVAARARFQNPNAPNSKSVLLFGDSYSRPSAEALSGMLAATTRSVEFIWSNSIDWSLVKRRRPDILIFEIAERFLARLADDRWPIWTSEIQQVVRAQRRKLNRSLAGRIALV